MTRLELTDGISVVRHTNGPVAHVFKAKDRHFYWINLLTDEPPVGPFRTRERAEISADINADIDKYLQMLDA